MVGTGFREITKPSFFHGAVRTIVSPMKSSSFYVRAFVGPRVWGSGMVFTGFWG